MRLKKHSPLLHLYFHHPSLSWLFLFFIEQRRRNVDGCLRRSSAGKRWSKRLLGMNVKKSRRLILLGKTANDSLKVETSH